MRSRQRPVVVVGGGIVGIATALALATRHRLPTVVVEAESHLALHQSGRNSGVVHSGIYYRPGSLKARLCIRGREALFAFCAAHDVPIRRCGKLLLARSEEELTRLDVLERRGREAGLQGLRRLEGAAVRGVEPHAAGVAALHVSQTGVVDFRRVTRAMATLLESAGGELRTGCRLLGVATDSGGVVLETTSGAIGARHLVNCAGLQSDRVARMCGVAPEARIVPFRGDYYELAPERSGLVKALLYPVPDPRLPFLGVHLTRRIDDRVEAGPNALLALRREGYRRPRFSLRDAVATLGFPGFWRLARRHWRTALSEAGRSWSRRRFAAALQSLVPEIEAEDLHPAGHGIRAQAVDPRGNLLDDFHILQTGRSTHVVNAPSPAATASLAIGRHVAGLVLEALA